MIDSSGPPAKPSVARRSYSKPAVEPPGAYKRNKEIETRMSLENWFQTHCAKARSVVWETQAEKKIVDGSSRKLAK